MSERLTAPQSRMLARMRTGEHVPVVGTQHATVLALRRKGYRVLISAETHGGAQYAPYECWHWVASLPEDGA